MLQTLKIKFDDEVNLQVYLWPSASGIPCGTIQIIHGMAEHMGRYHEFGEKFSSLGYNVLGVDLYAHGLSADDESMIGKVKKYDFMDAMIKSVKLIREEYDYLFFDENAILFAHSMGSFVAQRYITLFPYDFNKVIFSGTDAFNIKYLLGTLLVKPFKGKNKEIYYSNFAHKVGIGAFDKRFKNDAPTSGWLTHDLKEVEKYRNDPMCGKLFPANYFYSLGKLMGKNLKKANLVKINKSVKIMIIYGHEDPVGNYGKGPKKLAKVYSKYQLSVKLIKYQGRHELLNELPEIKTQVYDDIVNFIKN